MDFFPRFHLLGKICIASAALASEPSLARLTQELAFKSLALSELSSYVK